jgi:uncharacterized membrane protein (UPF0127 family)
VSHLPAVLLLAALSACGPANPVHTVRIGETSLSVEVVANPQNRGQGLMHRDALGADKGMLFVYPDEQIRSFWMKDTRIPLSIAFADKTGKIVRIADMQPFSFDSTSSLYPATYALEVNQGWFEKRGVTKGAMITDLPAITPE